MRLASWRPLKAKGWNNGAALDIKAQIDELQNGAVYVAEPGLNG